MPKISRHEYIEVVKNVPQERIYERSQVIEVPKTLYRECAEVENIRQERISERRQAIEVTKISCQERDDESLS